MIIAVSMFRDEADVAAQVVDHLYAQGVDQVVVADNNSTDDTVKLLRRRAVTVVPDPEPGYYQARKITNLIHKYCRAGDWVVPFDADELWSGENTRLDAALETAKVDVVKATTFRYIAMPDDPDDEDPFTRITWREGAPQQYGGVAFRYHPDAIVHEGGHDVTHPGTRGAGLRINHFQYRSFTHFARKVRQGKQALEASTLPASSGAHWRGYGAMTDDELAQAWQALQATPGLVCDPCR